MKNTLNDKKIRDFYAREGLEPVGSAPEDLRKLFERDVAKYAKVIQQGKIPLR